MKIRRLSKNSGELLHSIGRLKTLPHLPSNLDFNNNDTDYGFTISEGGIVDDDLVSVRNEFRLGLKGGGENFEFLAILESDFTPDKNNTDRGVRNGDYVDSGMSSEAFGVEKLELSYDFSAHKTNYFFSNDNSLVGRLFLTLVSYQTM